MNSDLFFFTSVMNVKLPNGNEIPLSLFMTTSMAFELLRGKNTQVLSRVWAAVVMSREISAADIDVLKTCGLAADGGLHQCERDFLTFYVTPGPKGSILINGK